MSSLDTLSIQAVDIPRTIRRIDSAWRMLAVGLVIVGCSQFKSAFTRAQLEELGPRLATPVTLTFDRTLLDAKAPYVDSCGSPYELPIGKTLEEVFLDGAYQNFQVIEATPGTAPPAKPELDMHLSLTRSSWKILTDNVYDRPPAELDLEMLAVFRDSQGTVKGTKTLTARQRGKLILEPAQRRCMYSNADAMLHDGAVDLAMQFLREARAQAQVQTAETAAAPAVAAAAPVAAAPSALVPSATAGAAIPSLSFKATLVDEDGNGVLQGGERIKIRVDVVNGSAQALSRLTVRLSGTPSLVSQFPTTSLTIQQIQPGEVKALDFATTLAPAVSAGKAQFEVSVTDGLNAPQMQILTAAVRPLGASTGEVDRLPSNFTGSLHQQTFLLSIGLSSHRDQDVKGRKYAAIDAETVATYFKTVGGVPASNVRLLQDWKALRGDIEEALLDWLPGRTTPQSLIIVYFSGNVVAGPTGELFLVPYEGTLGSVAGAYSLKDFQAGLSRLRAAQTLFIFEGNISKSGNEPRGKVQPQWDPPFGNHLRVISTTGFGKSMESDKLRHGLFTYYFLRGLKGEADSDLNGEVTIGEVIAFVRDRVPPASKGDVPQLQVPLILPSLSKSAKAADLPLAKAESGSAMP